jgi:DNA-directed RNA polymerase III subunit RPC1
MGGDPLFRVPFPYTSSSPAQVCVPQHMAVVLTYPERVTRHNLDKLRQRVLNGAADRRSRGVYPSVAQICLGSTG